MTPTRRRQDRSQQPPQPEWTDELPLWTIYDRPKDYPDKIVVRRWVVKQGHAEAMADDNVELFDHLLSARMSLPLGLTRLSRAASDDPAIIETWI